MWARCTQRGLGCAGRKRTRSTRSTAARRPYKRRTRWISAWRLWLQLDAASVRRQSCSLRVERREVGGERERAQMPEAGQPHREVPAAVTQAHEQRVLHLIEVSPGVVVESAPVAFRERPQAGAKFVAPRPDGLERRAGGEADLALDAVDLDGGREPVAVAVDALGDADAAGARPAWRVPPSGFGVSAPLRQLGWRSGSWSAPSYERPRGPLDLADDLSVGRPGPRAPDVLVGVVADDQPSARGVAAGALTSPSPVRMTKMRPVRRRRAARLTRIEEPSTRVGSIDSPETSMTRQLRATRPWRASHARPDGNERRDPHGRHDGCDGRGGTTTDGRHGGDGRLRAGGRRVQRRPVRLDDGGRRPVLRLRVQAEPREPRRHPVGVEP